MDASSRPVARRASLTVRNVGGIDETTVDLGAGVTVLEGRNATNRTSLLQAIMAGCGSDDVSLKADADSGSVTLTLGEERYERTLTRGPSGEVVGSGESPLDAVGAAELFAFLLESNEARRAVARGDDLRELIMRPVDTAAIRRDIREAERRKRDVDDRLGELETLERARPDLERRHDQLSEQIEETESELAAVEADIDDTSASLGDERAEQGALEADLDRLRELRSRLDDVRYDRETERESLERLREERDDLRAELESLPEADDGELASLRAEIDDLRSERSRLEGKLSELDTVVQFNRKLLDGAGDAVRDALASAEEPTDGALTDQLVDDDAVRCWTCGSTVEAGEIEATVDLLEELRERTAEERDEVQAELERLDRRVEELESQQRRRRELRQRLDRVEADIEAAASTVSTLADRRESLEADIESVEAAVEQRRDESRSELLDLHDRANDLERELGRLHNERETVEAELEEVRAGLEEKAELEAERERVSERLIDLRTRIERVQTDAIETFNEEMAAVLDRLGYGNLERVWLERTQPADAETARFHLHIVRDGGDAVYEDAVTNLSESEREVVGLVFALAGYLVHEVYEDCPFVLLDSLEAIDSARIASLVDYFGDYSDYLVVALLPEDAAAVDADHVVTDI